ncbi:MAG TPA: IS1380 family transposase [Geminicoccaceae bacterium]|nr:IS1380 family transposase [Geminicoccaceae bacterium]
MATDCIAQLTFRYQGLRTPIVARFDVPHASSDGGLVLLKAVDDRLRLTEAVAQCLTDRRQPGKVAHSVLDLVRQRVFGLAAGYLDGNDAARLADDPLHKLVLDREPLTGSALGSQPTLSRFENGLGRRDLIRVGQGLARAVIAHHRRRLHGRARRITIDLDPTDDPTHGQQELSFFNGHYDTACYLPLVATLTFDDEPIQYLVGIVLRPGNAAAGRGAIGRLRWLFRALRRAFPRTTLRVRLDGGFAGPRLLTFLDRAGVEYVVGLPGNARLDKRVRRLRGRARVLFRITGQATPVFGETRYAARSWRRKRRVIMKAEVVQYPGRVPRDNPRFVVTNLTLEPEAVYAVYRQRGDVENRHKELKDSLGLGRTSCPRFLANQVRVLLTATAYILFQTLQQRAQGTAWAGAQVATLRERLIKLAVWITRSARRIVLHLPRTCPWLKPWRQLAQAVGARAG